MKKLIEELTPRKKVIFLLSRVEGLTHAEIAEEPGISAITVKNHLVATLAFLKSKIPENMLSVLLFVFLFL